jgi:hypothetical protein
VAHDTSVDTAATAVSTEGAFVALRGAVKISRALVAVVSGFGYPSVVAVVAAGVLTFTTARVFAEAATLPSSCGDPGFSECSASPELAQCANCGSSSCGCVRGNFCMNEAGSVEPTTDLFCAQLATCELPIFTECAGKTEGEWCGPYRACAQTSCAVLDGGAWALTPSLACSYANDVGPNPPVRDGGASTDATKPDAGLPPTSAPAASDDSGCALAAPPGASTSALGGAGGLTLGMAFLWRLRRRRR